MDRPGASGPPQHIPSVSSLFFWVHPLLFAVAPALFVFANNIEHGIFLDFWSPFGMIVPAALLVLLVLWGVFRNRYRAALVASIFFLLFFSFGPVYDLLGGKQWGPCDFGDPRVLGILCGVFLGGVVIVSFFLNKQLSAITRFMNIAAISWVMISLVTIMSYEIRESIPEERLPGSDRELTEKIKASPSKPDIYYFIIDTYGRNDVFKEIFRYDNSWFLEGLKELGFYVANSATTNYAFTSLSIGSALNMDYFDDRQRGLLTQEKQECYRLLGEAIHKNRVMSALKQGGYTTVAFGSTYSEETIREADFFFEYQYGKSEFYEIVFMMTPLRWATLIQSAIDPAEALRRRTLDQFKKVPAVTGMRGPTVTFAHFIPPRDPFVFGRNGEPIDKGEARYLLGRALKPEYIALYRDEVHFMSGKILEMVREVLKRSKEPPVIIIQADHGPAYGVGNWGRPPEQIVWERMSILSAYYLPGGGEKKLYESISPVNSFRVVFDHYFGAGLPLLEDRNYFSYNACSPMKEVTGVVRDWNTRVSKKMTDAFVQMDKRIVH